MQYLNILEFLLCVRIRTGMHLKCVCHRSKLNPGYIFLIYVDSQFSLSPSPNS